VHTSAPPPETGYLEWIAFRSWSLEDLPAVAASRDALCRRGAAGDARAAALAAAVGTALWTVEETVLPVLRELPGGEDVPEDAADDETCPTAPPETLVEAVREFREAGDPGRAVERLVTLEYRGRGSGLADDARLARVALALAPLVPPGEPGPDAVTAVAVGALDPDGLVLPPAPDVPFPGPCSPDTPDDYLGCLWDRLAALALRVSPGAEAVDPATIGPDARAALARHGLLEIVSRALLPIAEDPSSSLRDIARELTDRFERAWGIR
jgi:hypothetical protein